MGKTPVDLLIFDLDGTLIESKWDIAASVTFAEQAPRLHRDAWKVTSERCPKRAFELIRHWSTTAASPSQMVVHR